VAVNKFNKKVKGKDKILKEVKKEREIFKICLQYVNIKSPESLFDIEQLGPGLLINE
jgi:hypothetical protein